MNRVAIVTGGTSGIGLATAKALRDAGAKVYVLSRHASSLEGLCHIVADVSDEESVAAAIREVHAREGRLDILVNNAGSASRGGGVHAERRRQAPAGNVNLFGMVSATKAALPLMRAQGGGAHRQRKFGGRAAGHPLSGVGIPSPRRRSTPTRWRCSTKSSSRRQRLRSDARRHPHGIYQGAAKEPRRGRRLQGPHRPLRGGKWKRTRKTAWPPKSPAASLPAWR